MTCRTLKNCHNLADFQALHVPEEVSITSFVDNFSPKNSTSQYDPSLIGKVGGWAKSYIVYMPNFKPLLFNLGRRGSMDVTYALME
jgi:hypothetical protein